MNNKATGNNRPRARIAPAAVYEVAPGLGELTDDVLFGQVWERKDLSPRDRSLVTIAALVAMGRTAQIGSHVGRGLDNGLTAQEIGELITHLAFYSGWPTAMSAVTETKKVFEERGTGASATREGSRVEASNAGEIKITRRGEGKANAPEQYFTGRVETSGFYKGDAPARVAGATVSFPAGARTAWHTHPLGQTLFVVSGRGWIQKDGGPIEEMLPGDVVWIPPMVRHWHGAAATEAMTHFAVAEAWDGNSVTWQEKVSDADYSGGV